MQVDEKTQAPESKVAEDAYPPHYSTYQRPGQRYSARAVDEHELYKEKGIRLAQGSELLLKHTDGQALSKEEVDALYSDHEEHTKQLFKNLQRLQSQRQKALKKAQQRTPPSSKTRRSTRVRVKTSSRRGKTPKSSFSGQLPRTPKSATIDNDAKTIRFRGATSSGNPRNQPAQPSQGPAPTGAHRGAAQLDEESKSSEAGFAAKRRNVAPLQPTHVNATKGTPRSTEFTHGAQYTRHAHMAHNQQMSTDPHPNPMYAKMTPHAQQQAPSNNGRPMSAGNAPTAHQARAERQSFDEEDSSSGGGMFPPDPDPDSTKTRIPPNRARGKSSSRTSSRQSAANASRHTASRIRDKKKSGRPKKPKPPPEPARVSATATDNASKKDIPPVKPKVAQPSKLEMKEIAAILRTVQGSISELSSKMGECTEAIRSLSKDQRKVRASWWNFALLWPRCMVSAQCSIRSHQPVARTGTAKGSEC